MSKSKPQTKPNRILAAKLRNLARLKLKSNKPKDSDPAEIAPEISSEVIPTPEIALEVIPTPEIAPEVIPTPEISASIEASSETELTQVFIPRALTGDLYNL